MLDATPWNNMLNPPDVDRDGIVTPTDSHIIVELLNNHGGFPIAAPMTGSGPLFPDVNGDWSVSLADWQQVCDVLNQGNAGGLNPPPGLPPPGFPPPGPVASIAVSTFPASVNEMEVFTITGTFGMAYYLSVGSLGGEFHVTGGIFQAGGAGTWSVTGYFSDDHGSGTASDVRTLQFEAGSIQAGRATATASITVHNVQPSAQVSSVGGFDEGSAATIGITMIDATNAYGIAADSYTLVVDWGDGHTETIQTAAASPPATQWIWSMVPPPPVTPLMPPAFSHRQATHVYQDDDPSATSEDLHTVTVTIIDDDLGSGSGTGTVLIRNVKPVVQITSIEPVDHTDIDGEPLNPGQLDEGEGFRVQGTVSDIGLLDTFTGKLRVDLDFDGNTTGDGEVKNLFFTQSPSGAWTFEGEVYNIWDDGPSNLGWASNLTTSDTLTVIVEVWDDDMDASAPGVTATRDISVFNVAPEVVNANWSSQTYSNGSYSSITVSGTIDDLGARDEHKVYAEFPDGTSLEQFLPLHQTWFSISRTLSPGAPQNLFPLRVRVRDDDSGESWRYVYETPAQAPWIDLDIDSDNDNKLNLPDESLTEDNIEESPTLPGKIILANVLDRTGNGVPDFADGIDKFGNYADNRSQNFAQLVLRIPTVVDPEVAKIKFVCDADHPGLVTKDPIAIDAPEAEYTSLSSGSFRIWTRNGDKGRKAEAINPNPSNFASDFWGDWVPSGSTFKVSALATAGQSYTRTILYVEGVRAADHKAITVLLDVNGDGAFEATDKVYVTIADLHIVYTDVTGIREVGSSTLATVPRIPREIEPDGVATDWTDGVSDGSILLMRVVGSKSLERLPSGFAIAFGMIDQLSIIPPTPFATLPQFDGEYHAIDDGWVTNASGGDGKLDELGIASVGADFGDAKHKVYGAMFYRPPVELQSEFASSASPKLTLKLDLAIKVTGDVETTGSKARAIKLVRPPVVIVHGINDSPASWNALSAELDANGHRSKWFMVDHSGEDELAPQSGKTFGNGEITHMWRKVAQKVADATTGFRDGKASYQDENDQPEEEFLFPWASSTKGYRIAVQKVDVVAHSYGGLLTRWYVESPDPTLNTGYEQRRDVRKVITMGTPHKGASISNMLAEVYKDGLIANAKSEFILEGTLEAIFAVHPLYRNLGSEPVMKDVVWLLDILQQVSTALPSGGVRPSYQDFSVGSKRIEQLGTNPFQDDVAYAAIIGTQATIFGQNLYKAFQPIIGSNYIPGDDAHLFPWLYRLSSGSHDTDGVVPTWSPALGVEEYNKEIEVNHLDMDGNAEVFAQVREWLNSKDLPLGTEQRAAYDPTVPASFANAYVGSKINAIGGSYGAGLNRDAIIKVELDPSDTSAWYGTRSPNEEKFVFGTDPASLGPQTVAITGMVQRRSIDDVHVQIVGDSTLWPDIVLDDLGHVQWGDMFANSANIFRDDTGSNDWVTFRIETGLLGRNRTQLMGPDGTAWEWGWVHYDMQVDNPVPGFEGFEAPPAYSAYFYYEVVEYVLPPPQKSPTNGLSLTLFGAALARDTATAKSQTNTVRLYDYDNVLNNPLDPGDDLLMEGSVTITHPAGAWDGLLIPYEYHMGLVMGNGEVQGSEGSSGEASAEVYQYLVEPGWTSNLSSSTIDVP